MQLAQSIRDTLERISFIDRYKNLSDGFKFELRESFKKYSNAEVLNIIEALGYRASYERKEGFFKILQEEEACQFQFNLVFKGGFTEFIWGLTQDGERISMGGGTWGAIADALGYKSPIRLPVFRNYEELRDILREAFSIYERFKQELLNRRES